jgi:hypothetical protein
MVPANRYRSRYRKDCAHADSEKIGVSAIAVNKQGSDCQPPLEEDAPSWLGDAAAKIQLIPLTSLVWDAIFFPYALSKRNTPPVS